MENTVTKEKLAARFAHISGWGVDIDLKNDPTYPIKSPRTDVEQRGYTWERPPQQVQTVEILQSIERPDLPAVFGTTEPPSGLSGLIRRYAFTFSESRLMHWFPLGLADRVAMVEGLLDDGKHGRVPNIVKEKGLTIDLKINRAGLAKKVLIEAAITTAVVLLLTRDKHTERA